MKPYESMLKATESFENGTHESLHFNNFKITTKLDANNANTHKMSLIETAIEVTENFPQGDFSVLPINHCQLLTNNPKKPSPIQALINKMNMSLISEDTKDNLNFKVFNALRNSMLFYIYLGQLFHDNEVYLEKIERDEAPLKFDYFIRTYLSEFIDKISKLDFKRIYQYFTSCSEIEIIDKLIPDHTFDVNLRDGVYNIQDRSFRQRTSTDHFFDYIDVCYNEIRMADSHYAHRFFNGIANGDEEVYTKIFEIIGSILSNCGMKAFFSFKGCADSGKSTLCNLIGGLIGGDKYYQSFESTEQMGARFSGGLIEGKKLVVCNDLPADYLSQREISMIKQLCGSDTMFSESKGKTARSYKFKGKLILCSNHPLKIKNPEQETALFRRIEYLPFTRPLSREICNIQLLLEDKAWIIGNALAAVSDLVERDFVFTPVSLPDEFFEEDTQGKDDDIGEFISAHTVVMEGAFTSTEELYSAYSNLNSGYRTVNKDTFSKRASEILSAYRGRKGDLRGYRGILITR